MNPEHLRTFVWLRYRLVVNQLKRGGIANSVILALMAVSVVLAVFGSLVIAFVAGVFAFEHAPAPVVMYVWDGIVIAFLFLWGVGMLTELQRAEAFSLEKFLHLPVSLSGVFALNFLSSLVSLSLIVFAPAMLGLSLGLSIGKGPLMLLLVPLVLSFLLMVTALTYQFQGWLASLMVNKRRRRTIIAMLTLGLILLLQAPQLIHVLKPWDRGDKETKRLNEKRAEFDRAFQAKEITEEKRNEEIAALMKAHQAKNLQDNGNAQRMVEEVVWYANMVLPIGWLPLGAMTLAEGSVVAALLGTLGMGGIGSASLWRAYRTTVRYYTGDFTSGKQQPIPVVVAGPIERPPDGLLSKKLPWLSEPATAVALGTFRALTRAPESKMLLISPLIMIVVFGGFAWNSKFDMPDFARPLVVFGGMMTFLLTMMQFVGNQFGFDRTGFRIYVLSPVPRRDILLGKNLASLPFAGSLSLIAIVMVQAIYPMRIDHFLAQFPQWISMYLLFCMVANLLSIYAPLAMAQGAVKAANTKFIPMLLNMLFVSLLPLFLAPTLIPFGIELGLEAMDWVQGVPIYLALSLLECAGVVGLYRVVLTWQGGLLEMREQRILEVVTTKAE